MFENVFKNKRVEKDMNKKRINTKHWSRCTVSDRAFRLSTQTFGFTISPNPTCYRSLLFNSPKLCYLSSLDLNIYL